MAQRKKTDFDYLMDEIYEFVDRAVGTLNRYYISQFNKLKTVPADEINTLRAVKEVYEAVDQRTREYYLMIARKVYVTVAKYYGFEIPFEVLGVDWVARILEGFDPVTKYVYIHEVDRKSARTFEAMIASEIRTQEIENGLRQWYRQAKQYADNIVKEAIDELFEENDVEYVRWVTELDGKACAQCEDLHGKVFKKGTTSPPIHYGCRCYLEKVDE